MKELKLRRIRKLWHKGLSSLPGLDGRRHRVGEELEGIPAGVNVEFDVTPNEEANLARVLRDDRLARKLISMRQKKYPYGTIPELIMVDYLDRVGERYKYQAQLLGGWRGGGLVPDFIVSGGGGGRALLINGQYWHNIPGKKTKDAADKLRLLNAYFEGELIKDVVIVWEGPLMAPGREGVMQDAVAGVERGP